MKTIILIKNDFNDDGEYIGETDVSNFDGNLEIEEGLGFVKFNSISVKGYILAKAGDGIKAGWGIEAGDGIKAGWGIEAGDGIKAGWGIEAGSGIEAGWGIEAGSGIEAGDGIEAGWGIEAGDGIKAGSGIKAGLFISCKTNLFSKLRIFAGLAIWKTPTDDELKITCGKLECGDVCFGNLIETGFEKDAIETINIGGVDYSKNEVEQALTGIKPVI